MIKGFPDLSLGCSMHIFHMEMDISLSASFIPRYKFFEVTSNLLYNNQYYIEPAGILHEKGKLMNRKHLSFLCPSVSVSNPLPFICSFQGQDYLFLYK